MLITIKNGLGSGAKAKLQIVEEEEMNYKGCPTKVMLATVKTSAQPTVSLGGFEWHALWP